MEAVKAISILVTIISLMVIAVAIASSPLKGSTQGEEDE